MADITDSTEGNPAEQTNLTTCSTTDIGSIEKGLAGDYELSALAILKEASDRIKGQKGLIWLAILITIIITSMFNLISQFILGKLGLNYSDSGPLLDRTWSIGIRNILGIFVSAPLGVGMAMLGIKIANDVKVEATEVVNYFEKAVLIVGTTVLMYLLIMVGLLLFILPGIYLGLAYSLALPLMINKGLSPWEALETSRKAITHQWFNLFGLYFLYILLIIASLFTLGIGFIWTIPIGVTMKGIVYRTLFGYEAPPDDVSIRAC